MAASLAVQLHAEPQPTPHPQPAPIERHLANIRQITAGRQNTQARFSTDGRKLIFQSTNNWGHAINPPPDKPASSANGLGCYQIHAMDLDSGSIRRVSLGADATSGGYFFPGGRRALFSLAPLAGGCPPGPERQGQSRWALDDDDIFAIGLNGQGLHRMTANPGYDAEATVSPDGKTIVFTSMKDGDPDLYAMNMNRTHVRRLTTEIGYDGGVFFSPDSKRIVYRASHPGDQAELDAYKALPARRLVEPGRLEIFVMNGDGSGKRQVTSYGSSSIAPSFHPDGERIIFSSGRHASGTESPPTYHLSLISDDGTGLEPVTTTGRFNSFPMFSPDGTRLVWVSDRNAVSSGEVNLFIADWVP